MRTGVLLALALGAAPFPATARFAPAVDAPYRLSLSTTRDDGRTIRHFASDYDVAFARTAEGYRATLRLLPDSLRDSGGGERFARLQHATADTPLVVRLDRAGRLLGVEAAATRWAALRSAVADVAVDGRETLLAAHDRLSPAERDRTLAADVLALCAGEEADGRDGTRMTALPATGGPPLLVRETVRRTRDLVTIEAEGRGGTTTAYRRHRTVDRRSGLLREGVETRSLVVTQGGRTAAATLTHRASLTLMVSRYPSAIARKP